MPSLATTLGQFAEEGNKSAWKIPTMAAAAAAMTYSRVAVFNVDPNNRTTMKNTTTYEVQDKIVSQRLVMRDSFGLYLVLAIQPILTLARFLVCTLLYASLLDSGFSMMALLAGVNLKSLRWLKGAALSGKLSRAVQVRINIVPRSGRDAAGYVLDGDELAKDLVYTSDKEPLPVKSRKHVGPRPRQMLY